MTFRFSYKVDGAEIADNGRPSELLEVALGIAAMHSFQQAKPVILCLNGEPYRRVSVEWIKGKPFRLDRDEAADDAADKKALKEGDDL